LSSELCCKDQIRSNNNSALLDATRSPDYSDMPPLELAWDDDTPPTSLPDILLQRHSWVTQETEEQIQTHCGSDDCTTCRLCQQYFSTHCRLRVHVPQHFITTLCSCGEFSYHRDYILRHQHTMGCHVGHLHDVDGHNFPTFLNLIKPFITDLPRLERLKQGFPSPRLITYRLCPRPPKYKKPARPPSSPPAQTIPRPTTLPRVVLHRIEVPRKRRSPSPVSSQPSNKRRWHSSSPNQHSTAARNLKEVELRIHDLENEMKRLTPRVAAAASELKALRASVTLLKRGDKD